MSKSLPIISQSGIKSEIKSRLENPEMYLSRPLIIWRSTLNDGIQHDLLQLTCKEYNRNKSESEMKWYKTFIVGHGSNLGISYESEVIQSEWRNPHQKFCVINVLPQVDEASNPVSFGEAVYVPDEARLRTISETVGMPVVVYMPFVEHPEAYPESEQFVFIPYFAEFKERWSGSNNKRLKAVIEFFDKEGSMFEGECLTNENSFSNPDPLILAAEYWFKAVRNLGFALKFARKENLSELTDEQFRTSFKAGIPDNLIQKFRNFVIEKNL